MTALSESSERAPKYLRDTPGAAPALQSATATHPETPLAGAAGRGGTGLGESCFGVAGEGTAGLRVAAGTYLIGTEAEMSLGSTWEE